MARSGSFELTERADSGAWLWQGERGVAEVKVRNGRRARLTTQPEAQRLVHQRPMYNVQVQKRQIRLRAEQAAFDKRYQFRHRLRVSRGTTQWWLVGIDPNSSAI
ncbi:MAG: hypothetical protein NZ703_08030 [Gemmataceae bacterium]|nr:hypothetical protein [Gemmataceae bacterium]